VPVLRRLLNPTSRLGESHKGPRKRVVLVSTRAKGLVALSTLVHETLHQMDHGLSEGTVRKLEKAIVYLVIDNPVLFRRILRSVTK
jgi:hypothetical protein